MAASATMQSLFSSPAAHFSTRAPPLSLARTAPRPMFVRSSVEDGPLKETSSSAPSDTPNTTPRPSNSPVQRPTTTTRPVTTTATTPKVSTKFTDILAFSGPGPERINGRLAMLVLE